MKSSKMIVALFLVLGASVLALPRAGAEPGKRGVTIDSRKIEEADVKNKLDEPNFGYAGDLGSFAVTTKNANGVEAMGAIVVHHYPHQDKLALGCTKLKYDGPKRLGNVDGWVFNTDWDGKAYPSKIFFSADEVYFGGGVQGYIAADFREGTGWTWKLIPLRRMALTSKAEASTGAGAR